MSSRYSYLIGIFVVFLMASCVKTALPPVPPPAPPVAIAPAPPKAHQADAPAPEVVAPDGENDGKHKLVISLPEKGDWQQAPADLVPKSWKTGFVSKQNKALVLVDLVVNAPPAAEMADNVRMMLLGERKKCGPLMPFANGSGYAFLIDEGDGTYGKIAIRDLGKSPGKYVLQLYGQWPKTGRQAFPALEQFDYIAAHAVME